MSLPKQPCEYPKVDFLHCSLCTHIFSMGKYRLAYLVHPEVAEVFSHHHGVPSRLEDVVMTCGKKGHIVEVCDSCQMHQHFLRGENDLFYLRDQLVAGINTSTCISYRGVFAREDVYKDPHFHLDRGVVLRIDSGTKDLEKVRFC